MTEWNTNALIAAERPSASLRGGFVRGKINLSNSGLSPFYSYGNHHARRGHHLESARASRAGDDALVIAHFFPRR